MRHLWSTIVVQFLLLVLSSAEGLDMFFIVFSAFYHLQYSLVLQYIYAYFSNIGNARFFVKRSSSFSLFEECFIQIIPSFFNTSRKYCIRLLCLDGALTFKLWAESAASWFFISKNTGSFTLSPTIVVLASGTTYPVHL